MPQMSPNRQLSSLLAEANWRGGDLARAVNTLGRSEGLTLRYDRTSVAHWLSGTRPRHPAPALIALALSQRLERHVSAADAGLARHSSYAPVHGFDLSAAAAIRALSTLIRAEADPAGQAQEPCGVYAPLVLPALNTVLCGWKSPAAHTKAPQTAAAGIEQLEDMTQTFERLTRCYGGGHTHPLLALYLDQKVLPLLRTRPKHPQLLSSAGQLVHLLGDVASDIGAHARAQRYYRLAYAFARQASHRHQAAIALRALSSQATRLQHHRDAHHLAQAALTVAGTERTGHLHAYLLSQAALTHAQRHETRQALEALTAAEAAHDQPVSATGPFNIYPRPALDYQRGQTLALLKQHQDAQTAFEAAIRARPDDQHRPLALTHARAATHLINTGYLEAACDHWHGFLDHYPHLQCASVYTEFTALSCHLFPYRRNPQAATLLERANSGLGSSKNSVSVDPFRDPKS
ncbi:tol-pal system YbgF family protein [Streptomyces sp. NPDC087300]|uniref:tetratricopeptide repeat protein n=1 Tax=Streptomyces sp. NPDC087300 TaxID=3365780 RepID=UPI003801DC9D